MKLTRHPAPLLRCLALAALAALVPVGSEADERAGTDVVVLADDESAAGADSATAESDPNREKKFIEELSLDEVKRFLDPTLMVSRFEYKFQANYLANDIELYTNRLRPWYAINHNNAVWLDLPYLSYSIPNGSGQSGVGDIKAGWGIMLHENLKRRLTGVAMAVEVIIPTGDPAKLTGRDTYAASVGCLLATNPTDLFPVYLVGWYRQTVGREIKIQVAELTLQTFHLLPRGFFLAFIPTLVIDLNADFEVFSFGLGAGRALNRRFSLQAAYVQRIAGRETFNQGFTIGLNYLFGSNKAKR